MEEDFWDEVAKTDEAPGQGFADENTKDEEALKKEVSALREALKNRGEATQVVSWVETSKKQISCQ